MILSTSDFRDSFRAESIPIPKNLESFLQFSGKRSGSWSGIDSF